MSQRHNSYVNGGMLYGMENHFSSAYNKLKALKLICIVFGVDAASEETKSERSVTFLYANCMFLLELYACTFLHSSASASNGFFVLLLGAIYFCKSKHVMSTLEM